MENYNNIADAIEQSAFYKKYVLKDRWLSGSITSIAPITIWVPNGEIELQLDSRVKHHGRIQSFKGLVRQLRKKYPIKDWWYSRNDGSCPPTITIKYE